jgi:hypothetical protein
MHTVYTRGILQGDARGSCNVCWLCNLAKGVDEKSRVGEDERGRRKVLSPTHIPLQEDTSYMCIGCILQGRHLLSIVSD